MITPSVPSDRAFLDALSKLLVEVFDGPREGEAFILNPRDPGLLNQLDQISSEQASTRPMAGATTIAAHADHVHYGLSLLNRWIAGETNPWATADWEESWKRTKVDEAQWQALRQRLREASKTWQAGVAKRTEWDELAAAGSIASAAHTAYHLGAIRQILAAMNANTAPK